MKWPAFLSLSLLCLALVALPNTTPVAAQATKTKAVPYWASIARDVARMRKGPSTDVPVIWEYRRRDLPIKVVAVHENWRKVVDPDGAEGWMAVRLLSSTPTAIIVGETRPLREAPSAQAAVSYRAEPGVVGRLSDCANGWCLFDVKGRRGWVETSHIWGGV